MGERTSYTPGTFCWADLTTTDQDGAKAFYSALFGWEAFDAPVGEGVVYSMMSLGGKQVGAIAPQQEQQREAGVPPLWNSYVNVESADAALARARELGATVHADAFDVMEAGRMGVVQDPQGAHFLVWEAREHRGAELVNAHGALSWNELASTDLDASSTFYSDLFGWKVEAMEGMPMPYRTIQTAAGRGNGGMTMVNPPGTPPHWLVYFGTDDIAGSVATATEHGANVIAGPINIGVGEIAVVADPQGGIFALYAGQFED
jgi:predicted enzyme related to lactoylglutathione lyase